MPPSQHLQAKRDFRERLPRGFPSRHIPSSASLPTRGETSRESVSQGSLQYIGYCFLSTTTPEISLRLIFHTKLSQTGNPVKCTCTKMVSSSFSHARFAYLDYCFTLSWGPFVRRWVIKFSCTYAFLHQRAHQAGTTHRLGLF